MTDFNNGLTEGTNMMVDYLANSEKLIPEDQRWYPDNNNKGDDDVDEKFDTYVSAHNNDNKTYDNNTRDNNNQTHQSQYNNNQSANNNYSEQNVGSEKNNTKSETNKFIDEEYEKLSPLEKRLRRLDIMRALGELRDLGCKVTNYNIDDDYYMMKYELDLHRSIRSKRNWLGLYSHMLIGVVKGVELVNNNYNPFDFSLKGLSDEVKADKNTYYEILGDIYEHHNVPGKKMNPWFRLFVSLIGVIVTVGGKQNAHKFIPNRSQEVEDNEDYIEKLRAKAAKDSHSQMSNRQNQQNTQQMNEQNKLDDYMNRQHEQAAQRAKDLEELKRQELEYQKYQQMLAEQKDKFNLMKKNLELTASPKSQRSQSTRSFQKKQNQQVQTQINQKSNSKSSKSSKSSSNKKDNDTMSEMSTSTHNTMDTSKSGISQISINNNLAKKLNQLNNKNTKKKNDITYDQISFGSNKKR